MTLDLKTRLARAQVAACGCDTKSPVIEAHDEMCRYRLFAEAAEALAAKDAEVERLRGESIPLAFPNLTSCKTDDLVAVPAEFLSSGGDYHSWQDRKEKEFEALKARITKLEAVAEAAQKVFKFPGTRTTGSYFSPYNSDLMQILQDRLDELRAAPQPNGSQSEGGGEE